MKLRIIECEVSADEVQAAGETLAALLNSSGVADVARLLAPRTAAPDAPPAIAPPQKKGPAG